MKTKLYALHFVAAFYSILYSWNTFAEPKLNGMAIYSELGSEQFIAAVFSDTPTSGARQLLLSNENKAMEIRVLAEKLYSGRFKRMWVEGIAINAGPTDLESHAQDLANFTNIIRVKLRQGDILRIERVMGEGTIVSINDFILGTINNTHFFDLLLRTWIGPVPLSSDIKDSLLANGNIPTRLFERYNSTAPTPRRLVSLSQALKAEKLLAQEEHNSTPAAEETTSAENAKEPSSTIAAASPTASKPDSSETPIQTPTTISTIAGEAASPSATVPAEAGVPHLPPTQVPSTTKPVAVNPPKVTSTIADEGIFDTDEEGSDNFSADNLLSQQLYISKLTKWTGQFVKYPRQSIKSNQEGSVRLRVELTRNGKVKSVEITDKSQYSRLNDAASEAVTSASPYPSIPDEIKGDIFVFTVPVVFRLN